MRQLKISKSITNRDAASLDKYLNDISKLPMVTAEEETTLAVQIRNGDTAALEKLVSANLRFVVSVAKQYQNQGISLADLINEGNLGLIKAAGRFDETRGFKFISNAVCWIRQSIIQAISQQSRVIRFPLNKNSSLNKIKKAHSLLEQKLERVPTDSELAEAIDISVQEISNSQSASLRPISTDATLLGQDTVTIMDTLFDSNADQPDEQLLLESLKIEIERAMSALTEREKSVLVLFYGISGNPAISLEEIGLKFDLTRERVRQIKEKAIRKLRSNSRSKLLHPYL